MIGIFGYVGGREAEPLLGEGLRLQDCGYDRSGLATLAGAPANAHPHLGGDGAVALVHSGGIENYSALKRLLQNEGVSFLRATDSEAIAHRIARPLRGDLVERPDYLRPSSPLSRCGCWRPTSPCSTAATSTGRATLAKSVTVE